MKYTLDHGLLVNASKTPPQCCGYIYNFTGHGAFAPNGKVQLQNGVLRDVTPAEIDEHNRLLGEMEFEALKKNGRGVLYLTHQPHGTYTVATWAGQGKRPCHNVRQSWHNMAGRNGRTDVDFELDGSRWHGVNIGDNQICRVKRCKS